MIRLLRFINAYGGASTIATLIYAAPQIQNIMTLTSLITFIYASLGINLFGPSMYREYYNEQNNFRNIFDALLLLIRCLTGEDWNGVMHDLANSDPYEGAKCVPDQTYQQLKDDGVRGCGSWLAYPFFISFFIINAIVILDLSIGVFISALSESRKYDESIFGRIQVDQFLDIWAEYDPGATGWITADQLIFLIYELPVPYGKGKINPNYDSDYDYERIYKKLRRENEFIIKTALNYKEDGLEPDVIEQRIFDNELYWVNETKGLLIKDSRTASIVDRYKIKLYENQKVHYKDVLQQIIKNAFDSTEDEYLPNQRVQMKMNKMWRNKKIKKEVKVDSIDLFFGGRMLANKYNLLKKQRRDKFYDVIDINDAKYFTDDRDQTCKMEFKNFHMNNPFYKNRGISEEDKSMSITDKEEVKES